MSAPTPPTGGPTETPPEDKDPVAPVETTEPKAPEAPAETATKIFVFPPLLSLWILLAGLWKSCEVVWFFLRALARMIA